MVNCTKKYIIVLHVIMSFFFCVQKCDKRDNRIQPLPSAQSEELAFGSPRPVPASLRAWEPLDDYEDLSDTSSSSVSSDEEQDSTSLEEDSTSFKENSVSLEEDSKSQQDDSTSLQDDDSISSDEESRSLQDDSISSDEESRSLQDDSISSDEESRSLQDDSISSDEESRSLQDDSISSDEESRSLQDDSISSEDDSRSLHDDCQDNSISHHHDSSASKKFTDFDLTDQLLIKVNTEVALRCMPSGMAYVDKRHSYLVPLRHPRVQALRKPHRFTSELNNDSYRTQNVHYM